MIPDLFVLWRYKALLSVRHWKLDFWPTPQGKLSLLALVLALPAAYELVTRPRAMPGDLSEAEIVHLLVWADFWQWGAAAAFGLLLLYKSLDPAADAPLRPLFRSRSALMVHRVAVQGWLCVLVYLTPLRLVFHWSYLRAAGGTPTALATWAAGWALAIAATTSAGAAVLVGTARNERRDSILRRCLSAASLICLTAMCWGPELGSSRGAGGWRLPQLPAAPLLLSPTAAALSMRDDGSAGWAGLGMLGLAAAAAILLCLRRLRQAGPIRSAAESSRLLPSAFRSLGPLPPRWLAFSIKDCRLSSRRHPLRRWTGTAALVATGAAAAALAQTAGGDGLNRAEPYLLTTTLGAALLGAVPFLGFVAREKSTWLSLLSTLGLEELLSVLSASSRYVAATAALLHAVGAWLMSLALGAPLDVFPLLSAVGVGGWLLGALSPALGAALPASGQGTSLRGVSRWALAAYLTVGASLAATASGIAFGLRAQRLPLPAATALLAASLTGAWMAHRGLMGWARHALRNRPPPL